MATKRRKPRKPRLLRYPIYIVVIRQNLDDTIAGAYSTLTEARARKAACLAAPGDPTAPENMRCWDQSGLIGVAIYGVKGEQVDHLEQDEFEGEKEAA